MGLDLYYLKTNVYQSDTIEKELCEKIRQTEWNVLPDFFMCTEHLQQNKNDLGASYPLLDDEFYTFVKNNQEHIKSIISRVQKKSISFPMTYFGLQTFQSKYLLRTHDGIHEDIDHLWLRISLFIHRDNWKLVESMFQSLREGKYVHATPTLFNAGLKHHQMASCFLKGTRVLTENGYHPIESVPLGTKVWTHEKIWKPVVQKHVNALASRRVFSISFQKGKCVYVTEDHPFLIENADGSQIWVPIGKCDKNTPFVNPFPSPLYSKEVCFMGACLTSGLIPIIDKLFSIRIRRESTMDFLEMMERISTFQIEEKIINTDTPYALFTLRLRDSFDGFPFCLSTILQNNDVHSFCWFLRGLQMIYVTDKHHILLPSSILHSFEKMCRRHQIPLQLDVNEASFQRYDVSGKSQWFSMYSISLPKIDEYNPHVFLLRKKRVPCLPQMVYTLGVKDCHSYMIHGGVFAKNCFLLGNEDSILGIYRTITNCALISKFSGGVGLHCHSIRSANSYIHGTNGRSNGIVPMLKVFNDTARYVDQGGGKRNGSFAIYLEPWHADIHDFLLLKKNIGSDEARARDLFYALWVPDYFMECVENDMDWYLFDPKRAPNLHLKIGDNFRELYQYYVMKGLYERKISARSLWKEILRMQVETGTPYILYKDACNRLSNQKNLGVIQSSNLCCEIIQYSDASQYAVCNLASISLPSFLTTNANQSLITSVKVVTKPECDFCSLAKYFLTEHKISFEEVSYKDIESKLSTYPQIYVNDTCIGGFEELWQQYLRPDFDFEALGKHVEEVVFNLNSVIDKNKYPIKECEISNRAHRPMGIGCQGLADVFMKRLESYDSEDSRQLNRNIFEVMYFHALSASVKLAQNEGVYSSFDGSPLSKGQFHFELYDKPYSYPLRCPWEELRTQLRQYGCRNSLFIALMPTASTSQLLGNVESFEPLTSNFYLRRTNVGEFIVVNRFLQNILKGLSLWNQEMHEHFVISKGSVQKLPILSRLKNVFRTVWEIPQKHLIQMAAERQYFIDQSQSMNIYLTNPSIETLTKIHFFGWKSGLKTGSYYIRTRQLNSSQNFFMKAEREQELQECENCSA